MKTANLSNKSYKDLAKDVDYIAYLLTKYEYEEDYGRSIESAWEEDKYLYRQEYATSSLVYPDDVDLMVEDDHKDYQDRANKHFDEADKLKPKINEYIKEYGKDVIDVIKDFAGTDLMYLDEKFKYQELMCKYLGDILKDQAINPDLLRDMMNIPEDMNLFELLVEHYGPEDELDLNGPDDIKTPEYPKIIPEFIPAMFGELSSYGIDAPNVLLSCQNEDIVLETLRCVDFINDHFYPGFEKSGYFINGYKNSSNLEINAAANGLERYGNVYFTLPDPEEEFECPEPDWVDIEH